MPALRFLAGCSGGRRTVAARLAKRSLGPSVMLVLLVLLAAPMVGATGAHALSGAAFSATCSYNDYHSGANNEAIYSVVVDAHQGNRGIQIASITDYKVPSSTGGYDLYVDVRVDTSKTFPKPETSPVCKASTSSGSFAVTTLFWAAYNDVSQGGVLQNTQGEALSRAIPSGDFQVLQSINGGVPSGIQRECCQVTDTTTSHEYIFTRVVDVHNVNIGYKITDIHFYEDYSAAEHKYKMSADIIVDSSQTYTATIPGNAVGISTETSAGANNMRWQIWQPTGHNHMNTRAEAYGGFDEGFPVIEQSACSC
jgi:hypothetical protein